MGDLIKQAASQELQAWTENNPWLAARDITPDKWNTLKSALYPGVPDKMLGLVIDYCLARNLDIMAKPVYLVPYKGKHQIILGIGAYRATAHRCLTYAGCDAPKYGDSDTITVGNQTICFPIYCDVTVHRVVEGERVPFTAREFWLENFKTDSYGQVTKFWRERPYAQLAKCAEAQALRKAFPEEMGSMPTYEEVADLSTGDSYDYQPEAYYEPPSQEYQPKDSFSQLEDFFEADVVEDNSPKQSP